jgi:tetratricopeptide (TPR) repeat protein
MSEVATRPPALPALDDPRVIVALEEYLAEIEAGRVPERQAFLERHAAVADALATCLDGMDVLHSLEPGPPDALGTPSPAGQLGDFRLLREVGRGGMGVVYEAEQVSLNRRVAVKVLPFAIALDPRQLQRFKNESQAAAQLHHTNIVPVFFVGCERGVHFYAMQYIEGQTLAAAIQETRRLVGSASGQPPDETTPYQKADTPQPPVPKQFADSGLAAKLSSERSIRNRAYCRIMANLCVQAAHALEHAHQMGVIHRDIKPGNLMVDVRGNLWITDFGLAHCRSQAGLTMTGDLVGTLRYMSPEQALAKRVVVDHRTDIYSLGVTLYELLTLEPAFNGTDRNELLRQIAFEEPRPPRRLNKAIPAELETIVLKAIEKNPAERYGTAQELADDLERFLKDEPIRAKRPSLVQKTRKWARRHRAAVWSATAAVMVSLAGLAGGIGWGMRDREARDKEETTRRQEIIRQAQDSVTAVRTQLAANNLVLASLKLAEAKALRGNDPAALGDLAKEIEALDVELNRFDRYLDLLDQAFQAEIPPSPIEAAGGTPGMPPNQSSSQIFKPTPAKAVPIVLKALALYSVLDRDDWSTSLENGLLGPAQVEQVRRTAFEELIWLADDVVGRRHDHRSDRELTPADSARQALAYLRKAEGAQQPTRAFFRLRALCRGLLGEKVAAQADVKRAETTPLKMAQDHFLLGQGAYWRAWRHDEARLRANAAGKPDLGHKEFVAVLRDKATAIEEFETALFLEPTHYMAMMRLGQCRAFLHPMWFDLNAAAALFTGCIMHRPDHAHAYACRASVFSTLRRYKDALADYTRAIELGAELPQIWSNRGAAYDNLGEHEKAIADYSRAIALDANYELAWYGRAIAHAAMRQTEKSLADYAEAIRLDPKDRSALLNRGITYRGLKQYDKALADLTRIVETVDKSDWMAWHTRGDTHMALRQCEKAIQDYSESIKLAPTFALAWGGRGLAHSRLKKYKEAIADFSEFVRLSPRRADGWCHRGDVYSELRQYDQALKDYSEAIKQDAKYQPAWNGRGIVRARLQQLDEAVADFSEAIKLNPKNMEAWNNRADAHCSLHHYGQAIADYKEAIRLDERDAYPYGHMGWLLTTAADPKYRDPVEALKMAKKAVELGPKEAAYWTALGLAHVRFGEGKAAVPALDKAMKMSQGGDASDWFILAMAQWQIGNKELARTWYNRGVAWMDKNKPYLEAQKYSAEVIRGLGADAAAILGLDKKQE